MGCKRFREKMMDKKSILVFGFGYTATFLCHHLTRNGWLVFGTTREKKNFDKIKKMGAEPIFFEDEKFIANLLKREIYILSCVAPYKDEDPVLKRYSGVISEHKEKIQWIGYYSTTSVYGNHDGNWVTEKTNPVPKLERSKVRLKVENSWQKLGDRLSVPLNVFRISGIYGPKRNMVDRLKSDEKVVVADKPNQFFNRIHVDDIIGITYLAMNRKLKSEVFNISDDLPASQIEVADMATKLLNLPSVEKVPLESNLVSDMARSFYLEEKKISNRKIKNNLGYRFKFPTYKDGLRDLLKRSREF
jgi:NAD dependent epimerase/dehydratase family enzyme